MEDQRFLLVGGLVSVVADIDINAVSITEFSSFEANKGNATKALIELKSLFPNKLIVAHGIGDKGEYNDAAYDFWIKMLKRGLIDIAVTDSGDEIDKTNKACKNPPRLIDTAEQSGGVAAVRIESPEEDDYASITLMYGPPKSMGPAAFPYDPILERKVRMSKSKVGYISNLHVTLRRRGIGSSLIRFALDYLKSRGVGEVFLIAIPDVSVGTTLGDLLHLYRKFGFENMRVAWRDWNGKLLKQHPTAMSLKLL